MSSNRLTYDKCAYKQSLIQSVSPIEYSLDPVKYEHSRKCRMELGIVGGTAVSHITGNLVDLENDLRGQTRPITKCPTFDYMPPADNRLQGRENIKPVVHPMLDLTPQHLPACQLVDYSAVPLAPAMQQSSCSATLSQRPVPEPFSRF